MCVTSIARIASEAPGTSPLDPLINRAWYVSDYLESAGAVRIGSIIKRREIIKFFRNAAGGAHHDLMGGRRRPDTVRYELVADLAGHVRADIREGLYFELLSIGQSVARSPDTRALADRIRQDL